MSLIVEEREIGIDEIVFKINFKRSGNTHWKITIVVQEKYLDTLET